jgi:glycosyltransferase involved in cell wall biosynthesis
MTRDDRVTAVHVVPYYPPHQGGMERAAERLVAGLGGCGVDARVITSALGGTPPDEDPARVRRLRGVEIAHTPVLWGLLPALASIPRNAVVHAHVAQAFVPDAAVEIARRRGQPVVAHYHLDVDPSGRLGMLLRPYQRTLLRRTLRRSDLVVVPTPDYAEIVHDLYQVPPERVRVVPNGTDYPVGVTPRRPPTSGWRLISVGRLSPQKDFPLLFRACAALRDLYPEHPWTLQVHGDGELRGELEREIDRLRLRGLVELGRGDLDRAQLQQRYDRAHLFALATRKESFGIVYAEAMARGLPIVTTRAPGVRNVVRDGRNGLLAEADPVALAHAMAAVMANPAQYVGMSRANLEDAAGYAWPAVCEQMADLYRELVRCAGMTTRTSPSNRSATRVASPGSQVR